MNFTQNTRKIRKNYTGKLKKYWKSQENSSVWKRGNHAINVVMQVHVQCHNVIDQIVLLLMRKGYNLSNYGNYIAWFDLVKISVLVPVRLII